MSNKQIIFNCTLQETRVALLEEGQLVELHSERKKGRGIVGNIYKGKVVRVLPGMQAAFVDLGEEKAAFLYVADIYPEFQDLDFGDEDEDDPRPRKEKPPVSQGIGDDGGPTLAKREGEKRDRQHAAHRHGRKKHGRGGGGGGEKREPSRPKAKIEDLVKPGQEILCQVTKEPIGTKGARITSHVTIAGRYLVLMPTIDRVGISRRVGDSKERRRLREILNACRPKGMGFIVRTAATGLSEQALIRDMEFLLEVWREVGKDEHKAPALTHRDLDLSLRVVRDILSDDIEKIVVDDENEYRRVANFVKTVIPHSKTVVEHFTKDDPIFDAFKIEPEIEKLFHRKVWLKSGGYLIIDQAEALTAIDVNTGKFIGKKDLEETILKTNMEAAKEVVNQLKLRSIGGQIIIDFIDMDRADNRDKVYSALIDALRGDRAKTNVTKISELGLVEMTRKRTGESFGKLAGELCEFC
ncbi:MAG TPA: Rne/Rng family ribonuclease, partial [bacterium]|nr:Rne/Rng family ribonuclease [bacterium]